MWAYWVIGINCIVVAMLIWVIRRVSVLSADMRTRHETTNQGNWDNILGGYKLERTRDMRTFYIIAAILVVFIVLSRAGQRAEQEVAERQHYAKIRKATDELRKFAKEHQE